MPVQHVAAVVYPWRRDAQETSAVQLLRWTLHLTSWAVLLVVLWQVNRWGGREQVERAPRGRFCTAPGCLCSRWPSIRSGGWGSACGPRWPVCRRFASGPESPRPGRKPGASSPRAASMCAPPRRSSFSARRTADLHAVARRPPGRQPGRRARRTPFQDRRMARPSSSLINADAAPEIVELNHNAIALSICADATSARNATSAAIRSRGSSSSRRSAASQSASRRSGLWRPRAGTT